MDFYVADLVRKGLRILRERLGIVVTRGEDEEEDEAEEDSGSAKEWMDEEEDDA